MADGANGLIPGVATIAFGLLFLEYGRPAEGVLFFVCLMFLIFNVVSGWFFLGDMGSYGLVPRWCVMDCWVWPRVTFQPGLWRAFCPTPALTLW